MLRCAATSVLSVLLLAALQEAPTPPPEEKKLEPPTSQPAPRPGALRKPEQAKMLEDLLRKKDRPEPVRPRASYNRPDGKTGLGPDGLPLMLDGTHIPECRGRLIHEDGRAKLVLQLPSDDGATRTITLLENQLLETMERQAEAGFREFIVAGEITRYEGTNYLYLLKLLRRTSHGNLGP